MSGVAIVGIGYSEVSRNGTSPVTELAATAVLHALADAGLERSDVDGLATYMGPTEWAKAAPTDGEDNCSIRLLLKRLGLGPLGWYSEQGGGPPSLAVLVEAVQAVESGAANCVVAYRAMRRPRGRKAGEWSSPSASAEMQFLVPYGYPSAPAIFAMALREYMARYRVSREDLGRLAVLSRKHAALNPDAALRMPLSLEEYLDARYVAEPLCLLDCDFPVDGAVAVVLVPGERAGRRPRANVAAAILSTPPPAWDDGGSNDLHPIHVKDRLWTRAGLGPGDVSTAMLYDGFLPGVYLWLEGLGFCDPGEGPRLAASGALELGGDLPVNTHGGAVAAGRLHGMNHVAEAALQVMGRAGDRQVEGAKVALVTVGQGIRPPHGPGGTAGALVVTT